MGAGASDSVLRGGTRAGSMDGAKGSLGGFLAMGSLKHLGVPVQTTGGVTSWLLARPLVSGGRLGEGGPMLWHGVSYTVGGL